MAVCVVRCGWWPLEILGALEDTDQFVPTYELFTLRRESWLPPFPTKRRYVKDRDEGARSED